MKKYIIHDLPDEHSDVLCKAFPEYQIINAKQPYAKCKGCFGCWLKTPGQCVLQDGMENLGASILSSEETIMVSELLYGGFSVPMKRLWDRCIPGVMPFFTKRNRELHHTARYKNKPILKIYFYHCQDAKLDEKELAKKLIAANALNFMAREHEVHFLNHIAELMEVVS